MDIKTRIIKAFDGIELKEAVFQRQTFPSHFHETYAITVIAQGCERVRIQEQEMLQYAHSVSIINPYEVHSNRFFDQDTWHYKTFYLHPDLMHFLTGMATCFPLGIIEDHRFAQAVLDFHQGVSSENCSSKIQVLKPFFQWYGRDQPFTDTKGDHQALVDITGYIRGHLLEKLSLEALAQQCKMDKFKFIRHFKMAHGVTPVSYILLYRINHARQQLQTGMSLTDVALDSGFYDQSHFIHCFKKYIGVTPTAYKRGLIQSS